MQSKIKLYVNQHIERYQLLEDAIVSYGGAKSQYLKIWSQCRF